MPENTERDLLQEWTLSAKTPATFNSAVWRRIENLPPSPRTLLAQWFSSLLTRPGVALSYASLALALGLAAGHFHASNHLRAQETGWMARYIQSVDPYALPAQR